VKTEKQTTVCRLCTSTYEISQVLGLSGQ